MSRIGSNRRGADGVRVDKFSMIHHIADQCTTTLCGDRKETEKFVLRIPKMKKIMRKDSRTDIGRFLGLDQKRSGAELTRTNRIEMGSSR